jgi:geranylgeranyl diphosphate synthase type II
MDIDRQIDTWIREVDQSLLEDTAAQEDSLEQAIHYALSVKGKRLRPLLFIALLDASGVDYHEYMDVACAIEYIHTYSLIHDDLPAMDDDDMRRGMPTVHKKFNESLALLAGDTLLTMAFEKISRSGNLPAEKAVNIIRIITACIGHGGMAGGQALDLAFSGNPEVILPIHRKKTAELIKGTLLAAAEVADLDDQSRRRLAAAGSDIGVAFQMADDLLDVEGDEEEVGKKLKKDGANQSPNSVLFFGADHVKKEIDRLYQRARAEFSGLGITHPPFLELISRMAFRSK